MKLRKILEESDAFVVLVCLIACAAACAFSYWIDGVFHEWRWGR